MSQLPTGSNSLQENVPPTPGFFAPPAGPPYDPDPEREKIRGRIAQALIALLIGVVAFTLLLIMVFPGELDKLKTALELILAPVVTLVGTATGFYFGGSARKN